MRQTLQQQNLRVIDRIEGKMLLEYLSLKEQRIMH